MACRHLLLLTAPVMLLLSACVTDPQVLVTKRAEAVSIAVNVPGKAQPVCINKLIVSVEGTNTADEPALWDLSTAETTRCTASFTYGQVPAGFAQGGTAPPLTNGTRYLVEVMGPGLIGGTTFTMRAADGPLQDSPAG